MLTNYNQLPDPWLQNGQYQPSEIEQFIQEVSIPFEVFMPLRVPSPIVRYRAENPLPSNSSLALSATESNTPAKELNPREI